LVRLRFCFEGDARADPCGLATFSRFVADLFTLSLGSNINGVQTNSLFLEFEKLENYIEQIEDRKNKMI
jgi:hypothetical protein